MLLELQERFWDLIAAPEGVEKALPDFARLHPEGVPLERWVRGEGALGAAERLDIYANMYFYRLLEVLQGDYPKVEAAVGKPAFHNLITEYLLSFPSTSPSIRDAGQHLPAFLQSHTLVSERPYLPALATLEWARVEVFDREDAAPLALSDLAALPPEGWAGLALRTVPALRLLEVDYPVLEQFALLEQDGVLPDVLLQRKPATLLVWRQEFQVWMRAAAIGEADLLRELGEGRSFAWLCEELHRTEGSDEAATQRAFALLSEWVQSGMLRGLPG